MSINNIFIYMKEKEEFLKRRIMTDHGWMYFCRQCMVYKPEVDFYRRKDSSFGVDYRCKIHRKQYRTKTTPTDKSMSYLKLHGIRDSDFDETEKLLKILGYKICKTCPPVWEQFNKRYNLN